MVCSQQLPPHLRLYAPPMLPASTWKPLQTCTPQRKCLCQSLHPLCMGTAPPLPASSPIFTCIHHACRGGSGTIHGLFGRAQDLFVTEPIAQSNKSTDKNAGLCGCCSCRTCGEGCRAQFLASKGRGASYDSGHFPAGLCGDPGSAAGHLSELSETEHACSSEPPRRHFLLQAASATSTSPPPRRAHTDSQHR